MNETRQQSIYAALPWAEKYRSTTWDEVVGQDETVAEIRKQLHNLPHILFRGPPGTAKTTIAGIVIKEIDADVLPLNGSEDTGIDIVRNEIDRFVKHSSLWEKDKNNGNKHKAPFKIVFIDEADNLSDDMMKALRAKIEKYTYNTRFMLCVNNSKKIEDCAEGALMSRFQVFTFRTLKEEDIVKRLRQVAEKERLKLTDAQFMEVAETARGDMRRALNTLQRGNYVQKTDKPRDELDGIFAMARA
jgi:replication factor C small subunit